MHLHSDVLEIVAFGTFELANTSINDLTDVTTGGVTLDKFYNTIHSNSRFEPVMLQASDITTSTVGNTVTKLCWSITSNILQLCLRKLITTLFSPILLVIQMLCQHSLWNRNLYDWSYKRCNQKLC